MSDAAPPLSLPPLLRGAAVAAGRDPLFEGARIARAGTDPGLVLHDPGLPDLRAAIVLAPEAPLGEAMAMVLAAALGAGDALGALGPPELAVQFDWPGGLRVNGARCGGLRAAAATREAEAEPDWLVVGLEIAVAPSAEPGATPEETALHDEGCGALTPPALAEAWARHMLVWINRWLDEGTRPLHADWRARSADLGTELVRFGRRGRFAGLDERGGMLLRDGAKTHLLPLTTMLEDAP